MLKTTALDDVQDDFTNVIMDMIQAVILTIFSISPILAWKDSGCPEKAR